MDDYMRPVHWIVSAKREFNDLLMKSTPCCRILGRTKNPPTPAHAVYDQVDKTMRRPLLVEHPRGPQRLGMFVGQLYLKDYELYIRLCRFIGLYTRDLQDERGIVVEPDGFILPKKLTHVSEYAHRCAQSVDQRSHLGHRLCIDAHRKTRPWAAPLGK